jgi:hypothetical protein
MSVGLLGTAWSTWAGILFLLVFSAAVYLGWYFYFCGRSGGVVYSAVAAQIMYIGQILGVMLVLGWIGILQPVPLAALCALVTAGVWIFGVRPRWAASIERNRQFLARLRMVRVPVWVLGLGGLLAVVLIRNIFWGWFLPPFLRDDIAYHLTIMGNIVQSGAIRYFPSPAERISDFPINSELFQGWQVIFLGTDKLADLAFLPTILIGGLALYGICRWFGFSRRASVFGWALFAFTPLIFLQQVGSYNDAWMAALFLCAVYPVLALTPPASVTGIRGTAILAGICSGVILGTKFSGVLSSLAIFALYLYILIRIHQFSGEGTREKTKWNWIGPVLPVVIFGLFTIAYGGWPLVRNAVYAGNPLAPVEVKIGSQVIWPGKPEDEFLAIGSEDLMQTVKNGWDLAYQIWFERYRLIYDWNNGGTGPLWLFLGIPGAVLWIWQSVRKRNIAAILISVLSLLILLFTPAQWRPRYVLSLLLICGLGGALLYESLPQWPRRILAGALVLAAGFVVIASLRPAPLEADKAMTLVLQLDDRQRNAAYAHPTNEFYGWIEEHTAGAPAVIVYGRWVDAYPLYGSDLRNTVISLAGHTAGEWKQGLAESGADLVVVASGSPEEEWTRAAGDFAEAFRYENFLVWERMP